MHHVDSVGSCTSFFKPEIEKSLKRGGQGKLIVLSVAKAQQKTSSFTIVFC